MATSGEFKRLVLKQFPVANEVESAEHLYWKKFYAPQEFQQVGPVTHIDVSPVAPHQVAITSSTRIHLYSTTTNEIVKTFSRFRDVVYSGTFRSDGKLLVAGGEFPLVQVLDINTRAILRSFKGHTAAVRSTRFSTDNVHVLSCSDDKTARYWDLPTGKPLTLLGEHSDYVRSSAISPSSHNVWATGSYDHTVKLWDLRTSDQTVSKSIICLDHGAPVEACMIMPGGSLLLSAGGNVIKVWDILSGGRMLHSLSSHQKTITSLSLDGTSTRLMSGSLDGHLKIYDVKTYELTHGFKYKSGVLSFGMLPTNSHLLAGTVDGILAVRRRTVRRVEQNDITTRQAIIRGGSYKYFLRGKNSKPTAADYTVATSRHKRIQPYDRALRKFEYKKALNEALDTRSPVVVASILEELRLRVGLKRALGGRDEESLEPLLAFLIKYVTDPKYASLLIHVCTIVCDLYAPKLSQSMLIDGLFVKLCEKLKEEVRVQKQVLSMVGMMDSLMAAQSDGTVCVNASG
ncbi:u3 small nucleolar rna-associated [Plasmopara halstedii]|uniref:U3 small nucleolar rna-associated n=1 Tax=Plasmopara halstedii TaxID=4781 RepID=A0A0P1B4X1_PLAHL|nr:u3 small nucleolar rna-associated [Plasmopara halstedii]CEG48673.1 u3 small nucleolar rna-associated [Plasmopara halstedii]|eukprot:XP_024585042.1 u3 small nucleolar rna-associated [Plasmopara halstedii]